MHGDLNSVIVISIL